MRRPESNAGTVAAIGLGGVLALGLGGVRYIYGSETEILSTGYSHLTQEDCKTKLSSEISNPRIIFDASTTSISLDLNENDPPTDKNEFHSYIKKQAEVHNLTLVDNEAVLESLSSADDIYEMIDTTNTHTSSGYGFSIDFPQGYDFRDLPNLYKTFDRDNFDKEEFRKIAKGLVKNLYYIPTEVIELANIDRVVVVSKNSFELVPDFISTEKNPDTIYYFPKDTIYISLNNQTVNKFQALFDFTLSAAIDMNVCGIAKEDKDEILASVENVDSLKPIANLLIDTESLNSLTSKIKNINKKAHINRNYISPNTAIDLSQVDQQTLDSVLVNVLRINEHVPGYADFWSSLTYEDNNSKEKIVIESSIDKTT